MTFSLTVITATIPRRTHWLAENIKSVQEQTLPVEAHLIGVDHNKVGPASIRNKLAMSATTDWICFLDDDDLFMPNHVERLAQETNREVEVIYSWPWMHSADSGVYMDSCYDPPSIMRQNRLPLTAFIRTDVFKFVRGFPVNERFEDWGLWKRLHVAGARFHGIENEPTWVYRFVDPEARNVRE